MASNRPVTCQIRYTLDLSQLGAFETYARTWMLLIERYGGIHHGCFIPRTNPDEGGPSFPGPRLRWSNGRGDRDIYVS